MACMAPTLAWLYGVSQDGKAKISFKYNPDGDWVVHPHLGLVRSGTLQPVREISIPCGKCIFCKRRRAFEIGIRARCESVLFDESCFITLTCSDENLNSVFSGSRLNHRSWQLFAKRLRKAIGPFRYIMCGEYGEHTHRPHYHAIVFGHFFTDAYYDSRGVYHSSKLLENVWPFGHVTCSRLNDERIMYVAGYVLKGSSDEFPSYVRWSRRPGLGAGWIDKFWSSCYKRNGFDFNVGADKVCSAVIWQRKLVPFACRYFDERLLLHDRRLYDMLKSYRQAQVGAVQEDTSFSHSREYCESLLQGLRNRVDMLAKRLANRARDLHNSDYAAYSEVDFSALPKVEKVARQGVS